MTGEPGEMSTEGEWEMVRFIALTEVFHLVLITEVALLATLFVPASVCRCSFFVFPFFFLFLFLLLSFRLLCPLFSFSFLFTEEPVRFKVRG